MFKDIFKVLSMRIFLSHLLAFIAGVLICAVVNLWLTPGTLWFPWVLIGWGAAVATHAFALLLRKTRRRERIFIDRKARSFAVHLFAYLATVLILFFVNVTLTPKVWWFYWVALGWGAGVAAHGWCAFGKRRPRAAEEQATFSEPQAAKEESAPPKRKRGAQQRKRSKKSSCAALSAAVNCTQSSRGDWRMSSASRLGGEDERGKGHRPPE